MWIVQGKQERAAASSFYCNRSRVYSHWLYHPSGLNLPFLRDGSETVANNTLLPLLLSQWPEKTYDKVVEGKRENTEGHRHWTVDRGYHCQRIHADPRHPSHREERRGDERRGEERRGGERRRAGKRWKGKGGRESSIKSNGSQKKRAQMIKIWEEKTCEVEEGDDEKGGELNQAL